MCQHALGVGGARCNNTRPASGARRPLHCAPTRRAPLPPPPAPFQLSSMVTGAPPLPALLTRLTGNQTFMRSCFRGCSLTSPPSSHALTSNTASRHWKQSSAFGAVQPNDCRGGEGRQGREWWWMGRGCRAGGHRSAPPHRTACGGCSWSKSPRAMVAPRCSPWGLVHACSATPCCRMPRSSTCPRTARWGCQRWLARHAVCPVVRSCR